MGARNLDRFPFSAFAARAATIADMRAQRWSIRAVCDTCQLRTRPGWALLERLLGPDAELWDRRPRCQRDGCAGRVTYHGRPAGYHVFMPLTGAERSRDDGL